MPRKIEISGLTPDEILALPEEELTALVFCAEPLLFRMGTGEVLGEFRIEGDALVLELTAIDGGGEGVLQTLASLAGRYAESRGLARVEWIVHAVTCGDPNLKLQRILKRRGFCIEEIGGVPAYHRIERVGSASQ